MSRPFHAAAALAGFLTLAAASPTLAQSQLFSGHAFLQTPNVEVGVRPNGAFGSTVIPGGYNGNSGSCLGFIVSRNNDGFPGTQIDGDYFCPGTPIEGWLLEVDGVPTRNSDSASDVPGSLGSLVVGPPLHSVTWTSTAPFGGVGVSQVYSVANAGQTLSTVVTLTNTTGAAINGIRFARFVDPDNTTSPGQYISENEVLSQGAGAQVTAEFPTGALIALTSTDPRSTVAYSTSFSPTLTPSAILSDGSWVRTTGSPTTGDLLIALAVDVGTLPAGASTTFTITYPLTAAALPPVVPPVTIPTMTEWAMILFGMLLAGGAALHLQRRRVRV